MPNNDWWKKKGEALIVAVAVAGFGVYLMSASLDYLNCGPQSTRWSHGLIAILVAMSLMMFAVIIIMEALSIISSLTKGGRNRSLTVIGFLIIGWVTFETLKVTGGVAIWKYYPTTVQDDCPRTITPSNLDSAATG